MNCSHSVYAVAIVNVNMRHMHALFLVDNLYLFIGILLCDAGTELLDNRNQLRNNLLDIGKRPLFQCFCKNGVIGICTSLAHHIYRILHGKAFIPGQNTYQLRNYHGRMGVVNLDCHILVHMIKVAAFLLQFTDNQLGTVAHHEIFLIDTKQVSCLITVIRI